MSGTSRKKLRSAREAMEKMSFLSFLNPHLQLRTTSSNVSFKEKVNRIAWKLENGEESSDDSESSEAEDSDQEKDVNRQSDEEDEDEEEEQTENQTSTQDQENQTNAVPASAHSSYEVVQINVTRTAPDEEMEGNNLFTLKKHNRPQNGRKQNRSENYPK